MPSPAPLLSRIPLGSPRQSLEYRPDIDGLRALAVVAVLLFHARVSGFAGGYVGVDVFFVISGFLITGILAREIADGRFSLAGFYERRIRRIFPALFAVIGTTLAVAALFYMPVDFKDLARSAAATAAFVSNVYFWRKSGYFDYAAELKPLVHTWSLGVEEQYYIVWPLLLVAAWRSPRVLRLGLITLFAASLGLSIYLVETLPRVAFYLIPSRAFELLLGAALALGMVPPIATARWRNVLSLLGLGVILASVLLYGAKTPFPGLAALAPCLGAAAIIATGRGGSWLATLLSLRPIAATGRISYSLYLWHWPMIVLPQYFLLRELTLAEKAAVLVASFGVAALSYRWIEMPFRRRDRFARPVLFAGAGAAVAATVAIGVAGHVLQGFPGRFDRDVAALALAAIDTNPRSESCDRLAAATVLAGNACRVGEAKAHPSFAVFGDSFGDALLPGFDAAARELGTSGYALTYSGCLPLVGGIQRPECGPFVDAALAFLHARPELSTLVLVARWSSAVSSTRFGAYTQDEMYLTDALSTEQSPAENARVVERALRRLLAALPDRHITIVAYVPEQDIDAPRQLALRAMRGLDLEIGVDRAAFDARQAPVRRMLAELAKDFVNLSVVDVGAELCGRERCPARTDGTVLYADDNHVSASAALQLRDLFATAIVAGEATSAGGVAVTPEPE